MPARTTSHIECLGHSLLTTLFKFGLNAGEDYILLRFDVFTEYCQTIGQMLNRTTSGKMLCLAQSFAGHPTKKKPPLSRGGFFAIDCMLKARIFIRTFA